MDKLLSIQTKEEEGEDTRTSQQPFLRTQTKLIDERLETHSSQNRKAAAEQRSSRNDDLSIQYSYSSTSNPLTKYGAKTSKGGGFIKIQETPPQIVKTHETGESKRDYTP